MKKILLIILCALGIKASAQPTIQLVKQFSNYSNYSNLVILNNKLIMQGSTTIEGDELWVSDGTTAGTTLLVDLLPGSSSASPRFFKNALNKVLFVGYGAGFVNQLYITDATAAGTFSLCALNFAPEVLNSVPLGKEIAGKYFFCNNTSAEGSELWVTDGTVIGTQLVKDINTGSNSSAPACFEVLMGKLYFTADNGVNGIELWQSDGTSTGTVMVKDIVAGSGNSDITEIKAYNTKLYFGAGTDNELWQSDGTNTGTILLKDITPGVSSGPISFKECNGKLYFNAEGVAVSRELYETDGTSSGTILTSDISVGGLSSFPSNFYTVNNKLFMTASTSALGRELMLLNPSTNVVSLVKDVTPGSGNGVSLFFYPNDGAGIIPSKIANVGDSIFYAASESGFSDTQIWLTDGTVAGSFKLLYPATTYSSATQYNLTTFNNEVYFYSDYLGTNGISLYKVSGTTAGTTEMTKQEFSYNAFPNPSNGLITIKLLSLNETMNCEITNVLGEIVYASTIQNTVSTIDTKYFKSGVYFLTIANSFSKSTKKIIIK